MTVPPSTEGLTAEDLSDIILPVLPDQDLAANARESLYHFDRAALVRHTKAQMVPRLQTWMRLQGRVEWPLPGPLALHWTLHVPAWRGDADGWAGACKPWQDCLALAGIIAHDGPRIVRRVSYTVERVDTDPWTTLRIERLA